MDAVVIGVITSLMGAVPVTGFLSFFKNDQQQGQL